MPPSSITFPIAHESRRATGLEWLRAIATLCVVMLHAGTPYLTHPLPGLIWCADSPEKSPAITALAWGINGCIMPLFFIMSGYFAAQLAIDRSPRSFFKHRLTRLGLPFLVGMVLILPADLYVWTLGYITQEKIPWSSLRRLSFPDEIDAAIWGPAHLWYLEFLLIYSLLAALVLSSGWPQRVRRAAGFAKIPAAISDPNGIFTLTLASVGCGLILWYQPRILIGFNNGVLPPWENLLFFSVPFLLGWMRKQQEQSDPSSRGRGAMWQLVAASVLGVLLVPQLQWHLAHESRPAAAAMPPFLFAAFGVMAGSGLFGLALRWRRPRVPAAIGILSAASFWIYLAHHPLTGLVNIAFQGVALPALLEFLLTTLVVVGLCLASYEVGVRKTWLGRVLNGTQRTLSPAPKIAPDAPQSGLSRAA